jgi:hypothetical protein
MDSALPRLPQAPNPPSQAGSPWRATCSGCDSSWTALGLCHCSACHQSFSGLTLFDLHRVGGHCLHPSALTFQQLPLRQDAAGVWRSSVVRRENTWGGKDVD